MGGGQVTLTSRQPENIEIVKEVEIVYGKEKLVRMSVQSRQETVCR